MRFSSLTLYGCNLFVLVLCVVAAYCADITLLYLKPQHDTFDHFREQAAKEADPKMVAALAEHALQTNIIYTKEAGLTYETLRLACHAAIVGSAVTLLLLWRRQAGRASKPQA